MTNNTSRMELCYIVDTAFDNINEGDILYINQIIEPLTPNTYIIHRYTASSKFVYDIMNNDFSNGERLSGLTQSFLEKIKVNATRLDDKEVDKLLADTY